MIGKTQLNLLITPVICKPFAPVLFCLCSCFFRGNGGTVNVLRISGPQGYPDCGTQRYGDTLTNIVVVQFSDNVQTSRDKRYNLTCVFRGPGEAVVTSGYIGAGYVMGLPKCVELC